MDRATFVAELRAARAEWDAALAALPADRLEEPGVVGAWSVKDLISHVAWSEREITPVMRERALAGSPWWELATDERNARIYDHNRDRPLAAALTDEREAYAAMLAAAGELSDAEYGERS